MLLDCLLFCCSNPDFLLVCLMENPLRSVRSHKGALLPHCPKCHIHQLTEAKEDWWSHINADHMGKWVSNCGFPDFEIFNERVLFYLQLLHLEKKKSLNNFITMVNSKGRFHNVRKRKGILMGRTNPLLSGLLGQKKKSRKENNRNLQKKVWSSREEEMRLREFKLFCQNHSANDERTKLWTRYFPSQCAGFLRWH